MSETIDAREPAPQLRSLDRLVYSIAILAVAAVLVALIWQVFATGRAGMTRHRNES